MRAACGLLASAWLLAGCAAHPAPHPDRVDGRALVLAELAPRLRVDRAARVVEFDGSVPIDVHHPETPDVYLELVVTGPDTREHEALVVTTVPASAIHTALLFVGAEAGEPGRVVATETGVRRVEPSGSPIEVVLVWEQAGRRRAVRASDWIVSASGGRSIARTPDWDGFVFSGSRMLTHQGRPFYDADGTGVIVGLTTFGSETVAARRVLSPESAVDEPEWIASNRLPERGTPMVVRLIVGEPVSDASR